MIRTLKIALLSTIIGTSLYADNYDSNAKGFIGIEGGGAQVDGERYGILPEDGSYFHESDGIEYGVRLGSQTNEWRATFTLNYYNNADADQNVEKALGMVDYFFITDPDAKMRPFIGGNIGAVNYESTLVDVSDFIYGGQAGVVFNASENLDIDVSYRYSLSGSNELNDLSSLVFGLNYLY
jgi:opacity protein-like surface antigen